MTTRTNQSSTTINPLRNQRWLVHRTSCLRGRGVTATRPDLFIAETGKIDTEARTIVTPSTLQPTEGMYMDAGPTVIIETIDKISEATMTVALIAGAPGVE